MVGVWSLVYRKEQKLRRVNILRTTLYITVQIVWVCCKCIVYFDRHKIVAPNTHLIVVNPKIQNEYVSQ